MERTPLPKKYPCLFLKIAKMFLKIVKTSKNPDSPIKSKEPEDPLAEKILSAGLQINIWFDKTSA